jgi:hypothetical protein
MLLEARAKVFATPSSDSELPGNVRAKQRFQRQPHEAAVLRS